jgi:hypothetical protein
MRYVHLVIPELFLPKDYAAEVTTDLPLSALIKLLARGRASLAGKHATLESCLSGMFGQSGADDAPIAAISAAFDGLASGCWLRADPVNLTLQRDQLLLSGVLPSGDEAQQLCASLNEYFAGQGMIFFAPHPQRWYLRLDVPPFIRTTPLPELLGRNIRGALPTGDDAAHWHRLFNEIQMLLYAHPVNDARDARGDSTINSVWLWGGGSVVEPLRKAYQSASSDDELVAMFSAAADIPFAAWAQQWRATDGKQLLVWTGLRSAMQRGDLAAWRDALQDFETGYAQPLWQALQNGKISQLKIEILAGKNSRCITLTRGSAWAFWRIGKPLAHYSMV